MIKKPLQFLRTGVWFMAASALMISLQFCKKAKVELPKEAAVQKIKAADGFHVDHLYSPVDSVDGSWVSMTFDDKGRLITSDQYGYLYRLELPPIGSDTAAEPKIQKLKTGMQPDTGLTMGYAQGLLYAFNSLYVMVNNNPGNDQFVGKSGLYRLQDTNGDDEFDKITFLKEMKGDGEHGPHSVILAPDGNSLYVVSGNHTDLPSMDSYRLPNNWANDNLFPLIKDPRGHANDRHAPGGWVAHTDSLGRTWELVGAGFRNTFDIAFNEAGDLFGYDSDMEWDFGMPWYRPTRIGHITSGSEFGWRTGDQKWSPAFPDNLPPVLNIGQGSPTNLVYANKARFPKEYQNTLLAFDWSFGIIHALHLNPKGSTYEAKREEFLSGVPLPLTDGLIGPDGALYFLTGGRRIQSDLYRVYYVDYEDIEPNANVVEAEMNEENQLRRKLEAFHSKADPAAIETVWPYLAHEDRFIRYAARIAVEHQPVAQWQQKALAEKNSLAAIYASLALARQGDKSIENQILERLSSVPYDSLNDDQKIDLLRTFEVAFFRMGQPNPNVKTKLAKFFDARYPAKDAAQNRELNKLLVFLQVPSVVEKTLALMDVKDEPGTDKLGSETAMNSKDLIYRNPQYGLDIAGMLAKVPPAQHVYYAFVLANQKTGWTNELRGKYFNWFKTAFGFQGGNSYIGFIDKARQIALANVPKAEYAKYNKLSGAELLSQGGGDLATNYKIQGPGRFWSSERADSVLQAGAGIKGRDFARGKEIYSAVLCNRCHAIAGDGEAIGPDLTQLGTRFAAKDVMEAIIDPNKAVSDQYASTVFELKNGTSLVGRITNENETSYTISQNPFAPKETETIAKEDVANTKLSKVSIMLPGLINSLNPDELKDLTAFIMSGGNKNNPIYSGEAPAAGN